MGEVEDIVPVSSGKQQGAPKPRTAQKLQDTAVIVKHLGEKQLGTMLSTLGKSSIHDLSPLELKRLFSLIPPDQERSDSTPNVNIALLKKQQHDLENICRNPIYRHPAFGLLLPQPERVKEMNSPEVRAVLQALTDRVSQMMADTGFQAPHQMTPHALLRSPDELQRLLFYSSCSISLTNPPSALFEKREPIKTAVEEQVRAQLALLTPVLQVVDTVQLQPSERLKTLIEQSKGLSQALSSAKNPEDFTAACVMAANVLAALAVERRQMEHELIERTRGRLEVVASHISIDTDQMLHIRKLFEGPQAGREEDWAAQMKNLNMVFQPHITIVEWTEEFLAPYLSEKISPKEEDVTRQPLLDTIIPKFRVLYPASSFTDDEIEHLVLSAYLKAGSGKLDLPKLRKFRESMLTSAIPYTFPHTGELVSREETPEFQRAQGTFATAKELLASFTKALNHSLAIDFREMGLTEKEIAWLARYTFNNPSSPLPFNWRD